MEIRFTHELNYKKEKTLTYMEFDTSKVKKMITFFIYVKETVKMNNRE